MAIRNKKGQFKKGITSWNKGMKGLDLGGLKFKKENIPWNKGKKGCFSEKTLEKMSKSHAGMHNSPATEFKKGNTRNKGSNNPAWKGGISRSYKEQYQSKKYKKWRKAVFERDNYTCQMCGVIGGKLEAHHKIRWAVFPDGRFDINNGIALCKECHKKLSPRVMWFFGRSGAGKTTLAKKLLKYKHAIWLDGDQMRWSICDDLGFSKKDRFENNMRIARLANIFKKHGHDVIISTICPYIELRKKIRRLLRCTFVYIKGARGKYANTIFEEPKNERYKIFS